MRLSKPVAAVAAGALLAAGSYVIPALAATTSIDRAPVRTIERSDLYGVDVGPDRYIYLSTQEDRVEMYAPGASGAAPPSRVLEGPATGLSSVYGVAFDAAGRLFVANSGNSSITVYAPGAKGNAAPVRTIAGAATQLTAVRSVGLDAAGRLYVTDYDGPSVLVFAPGANGNVAPVRIIRGANTQLNSPEDVAFGPNGDAYVSDYDDGILVFGATANGNVAPKRTINRAGDELGSLNQIHVDTSGNVYTQGYYEDEILVFDGQANGDVDPLVTFGGPLAGMDGPWAMAVDADRNVYAGNWSGDTVQQFTPIVPFAKPTAVTGVAVAGKAKAKKRTVTWRAPADDGGAPVRYTVTVKKGAKTLLTASTAATSLVLTRPNLRSGGHTVTVTATNRAGAAAAGAAGFTVAKIKPAKVRDVRVKGKATKRVRTVAWTKPAWDGGAKITHYRVVVKKGKKTLVAAVVKAGKRSVKVAKADLAAGRQTVRVQAKNAKGFGPAGTAKFKVKR
jgi:sugar lactone lactonase YvrE